MTVSVEPFEAVFDGSANFVPRAVVDLARGDTCVLRGLLQEQGVHGEDGLDAFTAVPMTVKLRNGRQHRFALWRHDGNPESQVALHFPLDDEYRHVLAEVMAALSVPAEALVWLDSAAVPRGEDQRKRFA
jgi:hypothetical protein